MAKAKTEEKAPSPPGKRSLYKVEGDKLVRLRRACPKCGDGVSLAEHGDRFACGSCGYTESKKA